MSEPPLVAKDWQEILYALDLKAKQVENGVYDSEPGEVNRPGSETSRWAAHLRQIMEKIGPR